MLEFIVFVLSVVAVAQTAKTRNPEPSLHSVKQRHKIPFESPMKRWFPPL